MKSSKSAKVYDDAVQGIIKWICDDTVNVEEMYQKAIDIRNRPIEDFIMRVKMGKNNVDEYSERAFSIQNMVAGDFDSNISEGVYRDTTHGTGIVVELAKQAEKIMGITPEKGMTFEYVMVSNNIQGITVPELYNSKDDGQIHRIDHDEYIKMIVKLYDATSIRPYSLDVNEENMLDFLESI
jgi:hypothetical protein